MGNDHDHVRAFFTHFRDKFARGCGNVVDGDFAAEIGFIPCHNLRRYEADIANTQRLRFAVAILNLGILNQIRRKHRFAGFGIDDIGVHVGEFRAGQRFVQEVEPVVKLVVTEVPHRIVQGIHRFIDRVNIALFQPLRRHIVAQRAALNDVAVIDQHAVFGFLACFFNQGCGAHQAKFFRGAVFVIVKVHHITVQIGGFHDPQIDRRRIYAGGDQRGQQRCAKLNHQWRPFL